MKELEIDGEDIIGKIEYCQYLLIARSILVNPLNLNKFKNERESKYQNLNHCNEIIHQQQDNIKKLNEVPIINFTSSIKGDINNKNDDINKNVNKNDDIVKGDNLKTWLIWSGRILSMHQMIIKHKSMTLYNELMFISNEIECNILKNIFKNQKVIKAMVMMELIQWKLQYKMIMSDVHDQLKEIEDLLNISIEVTGAMGKRTLYQSEDKAQMYIKINKKSIIHTKMVYYSNEYL